MSVQSVAPVMFESISAVTATPSVELGTERTEAGEHYIYTCHAGIATAAVGLGLSRPVTAAAGQYSASVSGASGDVCVGFIKHTEVPAANYFWALKKGLVTVSVSSFLSSQSAGPKAIGGGVGTIVTAAAAYYIVGELTTAIVSGNSGALYVQIP